jgi:hypothetical protein
MGALSDYIQKKFGVKTRTVVNPKGDVDVATTVTSIVDQNPDRLALLIINIGSNNVYLGFNQEVSTTRGILIVANGGSYSMIADEDLELVGYPVYGVTSTGISRVFVVETEVS